MDVTRKAIASTSVNRLGYEKIQLFSAVNEELGHSPLQIYSPREVTHYEEEDV
jgi:tRNA A37 threonylcarbamoyladenosine synthetase subunit TsaC/SUA5/YrdC